MSGHVTCCLAQKEKMHLKVFLKLGFKALVVNHTIFLYSNTKLTVIEIKLFKVTFSDLVLINLILYNL